MSLLQQSENEIPSLADHIKEGAVIIDVGMNRNDEGKLCGDVDYEGVLNKASYVTPVPRGVGPMTITMLMKNTVKSAQKAYGIKLKAKILLKYFDEAVSCFIITRDRFFTFIIYQD